MKIKAILSVSLAILALFLSSCLEDSCNESRTFIEYESVYISPSEMRVTPTLNSPRDLRETGKIYFYNNYILLNELHEGIHVIDNADPSNPNNIGFINIPGNVDIAVSHGNLYADNYADLLTIDISNINAPTLVCRDEDVFTKHWFNENLGYFAKTKETERTVEVECSDPNFNNNFFWNNGNIFLAEDQSNVLPNAGGAGGGLSSNVGTGGSLARFTITKGHLYVINDAFEIKAFDIENPAKPLLTESTNVSWGIETLFPFKDHLFIGAEAGMFIYDISNPSTPSYVSEFQHARACDPVFVKDNIAFVTLRDGTRCQSFTNQLEVIDVSDIFNPEQLYTYDMDNPHGLSVRDNNLYICEGTNGLKVFDIEDLSRINDNRIAHLDNVDARDVISLNENHLLVIGQDGLRQYNTANPSDLQEISFISTK